MTVRNDWTLAEVQELFALPFMDLVFRAQTVHRRFFVPNTVQISTLLSIKTGACPEDCAYCPQSVRFDTGLQPQELLELEEVAARARAAQESGATRFCMGAAYRSPKPKDLRKVLAMIREVKSLGLETCATLGMLTRGTGAGTQRRRPRLLQSQPRHLAQVLRKNHRHPHLSGSARHAARRAQRRDERVLRRNRRHGRGAAGSGRTAAHSRHPARAPAKACPSISW